MSNNACNDQAHTALNATVAFMRNENIGCKAQCLNNANPFLASHMLNSTQGRDVNRLGHDVNSLDIYIYGAWDVCCPHFRHVPPVGFGV